MSIDNRYSPDLGVKGAMPHGVKEVFEPLRYEATWLHAKSTMFDQLFSRGEERIDIMNRLAPGFFAVVADSLRTEVIVGLCRLTDPATTGRNENLTLSRLAEAVSSQEEEVFASEIEAKADALREHCSPLRMWRNKRLAHTDFPTSVDLESLPDIPPSTIEEGLSKVRKLMNLVEGHYLDSEFVYDKFTNLDDGDHLMSYLSEAERAQVARQRRVRAARTEG